jgi:hypothetical protein
MAIISKLSSREFLEEIRFDCGRDKKGREKSYQVNIEKRVYMPADGAKSGYGIEPGEWFVAIFTSARDGKPFGPYTKDEIAKDHESIMRLANRRVENFKKSKS